MAFQVISAADFELILFDIMSWFVSCEMLERQLNKK